MIKLESTRLKIIYLQQNLNDQRYLDFIVKRHRESGIEYYDAACRISEALENNNGICLSCTEKQLIRKIFERYEKRGTHYYNSMDHYYDVHAIIEILEYKTKYMKLCQKCSLIKHRRK